MFERYDEPARRSLFFARYEASQLGSRSIDSEHLLLGLIRQPTGPAAVLLNGLPLLDIRRELAANAQPGQTVPTSVEIPFSQATKRALEGAAKEADLLEHGHIGTEHLLLGLMLEEGSLAAATLARHGLRLEAVRQQVREQYLRLGHGVVTYPKERDQIRQITALVEQLADGLSGHEGAMMRLFILQEDLKALQALLDGDA